MLNRYLTYYKPAMQFVVFCGIASMCLFFGALMFEALATKATGLSLSEINEMKTVTRELARPLMLVNACAILLTLLVPALLFAYLAYPGATRYVGLAARPNTMWLVLGLLLMTAAIPFTGLLEEWCKHIPFFNASVASDEAYDKLALAMMQGTNWSDLLLNSLCISLIPALAEEIFFRGCLQQLLLNWFRSHKWLAILLVAILFSAFHMQWSGFVPRVFLGLILGLAYYYSGSIWISISMHALNNLLTIVLYFLFNRGILRTDWSTMPVSLPLGLTGAAGTGLLLYFLYRIRKPFPIYEVEKESEPALNS